METTNTRKDIKQVTPQPRSSKRMKKKSAVLLLHEENEAEILNAKRMRNFISKTKRDDTSTSDDSTRDDSTSLDSKSAKMPTKITNRLAQKKKTNSDDTSSDDSITLCSTQPVKKKTVSTTKKTATKKRATKKANKKSSDMTILTDQDLHRFKIYVRISTFSSANKTQAPSFRMYFQSDIAERYGWISYSNNNIVEYDQLYDFIEHQVLGEQYTIEKHASSNVAIYTCSSRQDDWIVYEKLQILVI